MHGSYERIQMSKIASVFINNATREFDREYDYGVPDELKEKVLPGVRVIVPFGKGNRKVEAYIYKLASTSKVRELKQIIKVLDKKPVADEKMLRLSMWMKDRYTCTFSDALRCMLPAGIGIKSERIVKLLGHGQNLNGNQKKILEVLADKGNECEYEELRKSCESKSFARNIKALEASGLVSIFEFYTSRVREKHIRVAFLNVSRDEIIDEIESNRIRRIQQIRVLEMLLDNEFISVADIVRFSGVSASVLNTLKKYGYIDFKDIQVNRDPVKSYSIKRTYALQPTPQQAQALNKILHELRKQGFGEILLHGVTGSGKTEVYLQLIQQVINIGKQAIVLVPEISLTPQMVERFKGRFGEDVAVLHSRLSLGEKYDQWRLIRDGKIKVAVGARSAVFAPFSRLGMVIIDEEHENSYKSEITPKYHAADIARRRCQEDKALLLYGSATPSVETYYRALQGEILLVEMTKRANNMVMPHVQVVDMRKELEDGNKSVFSRKLAGGIEENIRSRQQTILFLNRRGYASFVLCRSCGKTITCLNCNVSLTYHASDERLICHYCGYTEKVPKTCPRCKSSYIRHFGIGTQKVEEELLKQFRECSVIRMDIDTTTYKNSHEEILKAFREKNIDIMVGTQMIAKGHDFPNVTLVGVLAADSLLNTGDYKASERTFQLITQVSGRAGRGELPGRVIVQTYNTEDFSIAAACKHDYASFYKQEIIIRKKLCYPPFTSIGTVIVSGTNDRMTMDMAKAAVKRIINLFKDCEEKPLILGPSRAPLSKIKNKYRWRIVIKCKSVDKLISVLSETSDRFYAQRKRSNVELSIDINPINML
jgi:primosomal protein N' (replication factor Y)